MNELTAPDDSIDKFYKVKIENVVDSDEFDSLYDWLLQAFADEWSINGFWTKESETAEFLVYDES